MYSVYSVAYVSVVNCFWILWALPQNCVLCDNGQMLIAMLLLLALLRGVFQGEVQLPEPLIGKDLEVTGVVCSLPVQSGAAVKFMFMVTRGELAGRRVKLGWYQGAPDNLEAGQMWRLTVRLKPPHGYHNPGGFNFERWARMQGVIATGYVRDRGGGTLLLQNQTNSFWLLRWRNQLRKQIPDGAMQDILQAVTLGFGNGISQEHRALLQNTGTAHLMAISGLHVGLVAGVVFGLVCWLTRFTPGVLRYLPKQRIAASFALVAAVIYSALAGFSVSTIRALIMLSVVMVGYFVGRRSISWSLGFALALILVWDPNAIFSASLWLSFGAVGLLIYAMGARPQNQSWWWRWGRAQWVCSIGLIPLTVWYFQNISLSSFMANVIAIPVVSFLVVPLALLGLVLPILFLPAQFILQALFWFLGHLDWHVAAQITSWWQLFCALGAVLLFFLPSGFNLRALSALMILPLFFPMLEKIPQQHFKLVTLDVGQGLACLIKTQHHTLLFDTGPKFEEFDAGRNIVLPYLARERIRKLDTVVVSHGDNDHRGGLDAIITTLPVNELYGSDAHKMPHYMHFCDRQQQWDWDGVHFAFLNDNKKIFRKDNNNSCVLKVSGVAGSVLLVGDIEAKAERHLLSYSPNLASTIIVVPHHGSKTSSTRSFIAAVHPKLAIFSFGYLNRFHHPSQQVVARYQQQQVKILTTVERGAIEQRV